MRRVVGVLALAVLMGGLTAVPAQAVSQSLVSVGRVFFAGGATEWTVDPTAALLDAPANQVSDTTLRAATLVEVFTDGAPAVRVIGAVTMRPDDSARFFRWQNEGDTIASLRLEVSTLASPAPPVATPDEVWIAVGETAAFDVLANDEAKPRGFVVNTAVPFVSEPRPGWEKPSVVLSDTATTAGTLSAGDGRYDTVAGYARLTYTAGPTPGTDTFRYAACHGHPATSCSDQTPVTIHVSAKPIAGTDRADVAPGESVTVDVLANDSYGERPSVYVQEGWGPKGGSAVVNADQSVTIQVPASAAGTTIRVPYVLSDAATSGTAGPIGEILVKVSGSKTKPAKPTTVAARPDRFVLDAPKSTRRPLVYTLHVLGNDVVKGAGKTRIEVLGKPRGVEVRATRGNRVILTVPKRSKMQRVRFIYRATRGDQADMARVVVRLRRPR
ncbi:hypothetical protein EXE59_09750 [Nocardioides eburneiflavus]|uniref:Uncharacterized protein n=1 Tax=Nocardioides eburneiflavus TaxID=2518372 RepID=A0A4Z1C4Y0_9ACTN|nr:Ig-like domain-containing protein [Nocardioides eburneiflavus]TGN64202.1 hypothetical protein EXE59_09750 [Nocardioides eburneiflavus]